MAKMEHCDICDIDIKKGYMARHVLTQKHLKNAEINKLKSSHKKSDNKNTVDTRNYAYTVITDIMNKLKIKQDDYINLYNALLNAGYKKSTIEVYMRVGYIYNDNFKFTDSQKNIIGDFIKKIKDDVLNEKEQDEGDYDNIKILDEPYKTLNGVIMRLYLLLPLRLQSEFMTLRIYSDKSKRIEPEGVDESYCEIFINDNELIFHFTKTSKYKSVILKDDVIDYIKNNYAFLKVDSGSPIYTQSIRTFEGLFKKYFNMTSQEVRRLYAKKYTDTYAKNILNHSMGVHKVEYAKI